MLAKGHGTRMSLLMRWLHMGGAIAMVGGLLFAVVALLPSLRRADPEQAFLLMREVSARFRPIAWLSSGALLVSGAYALVDRLPSATTAYHVVAGIKVLLALAGFAVALGIAWPPGGSAGMSRRRADWMWLSLALNTVVVLLSSLLRALGAG